MNKELQEKLYNKYPKIFVQKDWNMAKTCMCFGIETGDGWYWLIDSLCNSIQCYIDNNPHMDMMQVETIQVKEKFGGLRFYNIGGDDIIDGMIELAENQSMIICEVCGSMEDVTQTRGWVRTLCKKCEDKI